MSMVPRWFERFPSPFGKKKGEGFSLSNFFEDVENQLNALTARSGGLSISSDDKNIYVEADVPGLTAKDVDVSIDNEGVLWIKGEKKEEITDKEKKYYKRSQQSFSYCIPLWDEIDEKIEPQATCQDGVMRITFSKKKEKQGESKKIRVQGK